MQKKLVDVYQKYGLSVWVDNVNRELLESGKLAGMVDIGLRGLTSNPSIFQKAIASNQYEELIKTMKSEGSSELEIYWAIAKRDISQAADVLRPVYDITDGVDGYVSLEVAPDIAHDTEATIAQARGLWREMNKPNLMIKVPATDEGLPAITELVSEGININVTLIFGPYRYRQVVEAYQAGIAKSFEPNRVHSVASVFVSRVDTLVNSKIPPEHELSGKIGIAQSLMCYQVYKEMFNTPAWEKQSARDANIQRPLWASTSTKDPKYDPLLYVKELLIDNCVNTMPDATLEALLESDIDFPVVDDMAFEKAAQMMSQLAKVGIDEREIYKQLEVEGVDKFVAAFNELLQVIKNT